MGRSVGIVVSQRIQNGKFRANGVQPSYPTECVPYRIGDPLAQYMLTGLKAESVPVSEVTLDYSNSPLNVAFIKQLVGKSGWLTVEQLTIDSFEKEDILLHTCITDKGKPFLLTLSSICYGFQARKIR